MRARTISSANRALPIAQLSAAIVIYVTIGKKFEAIISSSRAAVSKR
jgi:hypothetical protein